MFHRVGGNRKDYDTDNRGDGGAAGVPCDCLASRAQQTESLVTRCELFELIAIVVFTHLFP
jgi:hypothetical protein